MSRLTRDGKAEPVSQDQILGSGDGEKTFFLVELTTSRIGNLSRLIYTLLRISDDHTYIHTYIHTYKRERHIRYFRAEARLKTVPSIFRNKAFRIPYSPSVETLVNHTGPTPGPGRSAYLYVI